MNFRQSAAAVKSSITYTFYRIWNGYRSNGRTVFKSLFSYPRDGVAVRIFLWDYNFFIGARAIACNGISSAV